MDGIVIRWVGVLMDVWLDSWVIVLLDDWIVL